MRNRQPDDAVHGASPAPDFKTELLKQLPALRAFARSLCGDAARADDLTQDTLLKAWANKQSFTPGTNMKAWLFTILRNGFYSELRRHKRDVEDPDGAYANSLSVPAAQQDHLELRDLRRALALLPAEQREALILVGASGCSYEEAAVICGCAVGTIKSRVSRARRTLIAHFEPADEDGSPSLAEFGETSGGAVKARATASRSTGP
ncbi:MAG: sigma-70 family RNA polymerase sigma factor [Alphaproteobacteria bacterium]